MEGGGLSQFVPVCLCTEAQGWNHGWGSLLCVGLAGRKAGRLTVCVGGGEGRSVISVMIFMDVSQNKALAELEADQSPIHPQRFSGHVAPWDVCLLHILNNYKKSPCMLIFLPLQNSIKSWRINITRISCLVMGEESKFWL